jgi:hypothetical protein
MNAERIKHNGHIVITDMINGYLFKRTYIGYTMKEAKKRFKDESKIGFLDH